MIYDIGIRLQGGRRWYKPTGVEIKDVSSLVSKEHAEKISEFISGQLVKSVHRMCTYGYIVEQIIEPGSIGLEIGVDHGDSLSMFLQAKPLRIDGVDPWISQDFDVWFKQDQEEMDQRYADVVNRFDCEKVVLYRMTSDDLFESGTAGLYDWIHIDGDHRQEAVMRDLSNSYDHLKPGGHIFVDDAHINAWGKGITNALVQFAEYHDDVSCVHADSDPVILRKDVDQ